VVRYVDYEIAKRHEKLIGKTIDTMGSYSASFFKDIFIKAGGFSTEYPIASGEDFDLAFNIRKRGYDLVFTVETFVYHIKLLRVIVIPDMRHRSNSFCLV
jgi:GT2 family glycosyltransferase